MRLAFAAAALLGLAQPAAAADAAGRFAVKGVGQARCAEFNQALGSRSPQLGAMLSWVAGYLSAANRYEPSTYDLVAWQEELYIVGAIRSYCAKNPATTLAQMSRAMVRSLGGGRLATYSPPRRIVVGDRTLVLPAAIIVRAQQALARRGVYRGPADGNPGAPFMASVAAFQRSQKLPASGLPDQETLFRLFTR